MSALDDDTLALIGNLYGPSWQETGEPAEAAASTEPKVEMPLLSANFDAEARLHEEGYAYAGKFGLGLNVAALTRTRRDANAEHELSGTATARIEVLTREQSRIREEADLVEHQASFGGRITAVGNVKGSLRGEPRDQRLEFRIDGELMHDRHFHSGADDSYSGHQWALDASLRVGLIEGLSVDIGGHTREVSANESDRWSESYGTLGVNARLAVFDLRAELNAGRSQTTGQPVDLVALRLQASLPLSEHLSVSIDLSTPVVNAAQNLPPSPLSRLPEPGVTNMLSAIYRGDMPRPYIAPTIATPPNR